MNIANIRSRFSLLANIDNAEMYKWRFLIDDAITYVQNILIKSELSSEEQTRIEALCAVYANKLYTLSNDDNVSSFTVGDVNVASSTTKLKADELWLEYKNKCASLLKNETTIFGRI